MAILSANLHLLERISYVGISHLVEANRIGIVGFDRNQRYAAVLIVCGDLFDAAFVELRGRAMIADERDHQNLRARVILQAMLLPIHASKTKIGSRRADGKCWRTVSLVVLALRCRNQQHRHRARHQHKESFEGEKPETPATNDECREHYVLLTRS